MQFVKYAQSSRVKKTNDSSVSYASAVLSTIGWNPQSKIVFLFLDCLIVFFLLSSFTSYYPTFFSFFWHQIKQDSSLNPDQQSQCVVLSRKQRIKTSSSSSSFSYTKVERQSDAFEVSSGKYLFQFLSFFVDEIDVINLISDWLREAKEKKTMSLSSLMFFFRIHSRVRALSIDLHYICILRNFFSLSEKMLKSKNRIKWDREKRHTWQRKTMPEQENKRRLLQYKAVKFTKENENDDLGIFIERETRRMSWRRSIWYDDFHHSYVFSYVD